MLTACPPPSALEATPRPTFTFKVPEIHFPLLGQCVRAFHGDCVAQLSKAMGALAPGSSVLLARYLYLRGLVLLRQGQLLDALLDFQSLYRTDLGIFPADLVRRAVQSLSGPERARAEQTPALRRLISQVLEPPGEAPRADDCVKHFELPRTHLQLDEFVQRVQESGVVKDAGVISRLFEALATGEGTDRPASGNGRQRGRGLPPGVGHRLQEARPGSARGCPRDECGAPSPWVRWRRAEGPSARPGGSSRRGGVCG